MCESQELPQHVLTKKGFQQKEGEKRNRTRGEGKNKRSKERTRREGKKPQRTE